MPELPYLAFHWTLGLPFRAVNRYIRRLDTTYTPRRSTVNEFWMSSPRRIARIRRVFGSRTATLPFALDTNQMRPLKSGSAELMLVRGQHARQVVVADLADAAAV